MGNQWLMGMTIGSNMVLTFFYDQYGRPYAMNYNNLGFLWYMLNQQGDVVALIGYDGAIYATYEYDAWGNIIHQSSDNYATVNPLRYRGYVYDEETELYYCNSRYYDPAVGRWINADAYATTGQGFVGNNMFAYCLNNPVNRADFSGTCSYNSVTGERCDCGRRDCPHSSNYIPYTVSMGGILGVGIGPLSVSVQIALVTDSAGDSEIQISYSAPNIFSTGLPSVDEMLADISADESKFKFGATFAGTFSFTNAPMVANLHGPTYSVGGAVSGLAVDYNAIPDGDKIYSGVTVASGMITPEFNVSMSGTFGIPVPFSVFDLIEGMYNGVYGR